MFPAETPQKRRGAPSARKGSAERQSGCGRIATRKPAAASVRPMRAAAKDGWSTYASPDTSTTSGRSQPKAEASARVIGSGAVGVVMEGPRVAGADADGRRSAPSEEPAAAAAAADDLAAARRLHAGAEAGLATALGVAAADLDVHESSRACGG